MNYYTKIKSAFLVITAILLLTSCSVSNRVSPLQAASEVKDYQLPMQKLPTKALVIAVHVFSNNGPGANSSLLFAMVEKNLAPKAFTEINPYDDFVCGYLDAGKHTFFVQWGSSSKNLPGATLDLEVDIGKTYFIAIETDYGSDKSIAIKSLPESEGLYYLKQTVDWLSKNQQIVVETAAQAELNQIIVKASKKELRQKLQCGTS